MILRVFLTLIIEQTITHMKALFTILFCLFVTVSCQTNAESNDNSKPIVIYRGKANKTLVDIANDLLEFGKYEMALELVKNDTSALGIKMCANYGLGKIQDAIDYGILNLRDQDTTGFYEGTAELVEMYEIFMEDSDYAIHKLSKEHERCSSNYQVRLLLMKILWTKEQYEEVIKLGDEFRAELPEMSNEVSFNLWRQDSLDSLFVKDRAKYEEIMNSYRMPDWNGVERINRN